MPTNLNIFLLMGQSNMAGRGRLADVPPLTHPGVFMYRDRQWIPAVEPLHTDKKIAAIGLGMSVAVELSQKVHLNPIGLVPCAVGGTPLNRWMPTGDLYENAMALAESASNDGEIRGVLWHQGEHDSCHRDDADTYAERFQTMVRAVRSRLGKDTIPVIAGELGHFLREREGCSFYEDVNRQFRELEGRLSDYACVDADGLTCNGDHLHFNAGSLREFGLRYADAYMKVAGLLGT